MVIKVGFLGPMGSYSEKVARDMARHPESSQWVEIGTIPEVIENVATGLVGEGIVPLRTAYGDVPETLDALHRAVVGMGSQGGSIFITGYSDRTIKFWLGGLPGATLADIAEVVTKQEAVQACASEISRLVPGYAPVYQASTALGARMVATSGHRTRATLCSLEALHENGLVPLLSSPIIRVTSFIRVGPRRYAGAQYDESAVMVRVLQDRPGILKSIGEAVDPLNLVDFSVLKNRLDVGDKMAQVVFLLRIKAGVREAELVVEFLRAMFRVKEELFGVPEDLRSLVTNLGSYPVLL
ncbi:MAG: hypothetical protein HY482_01335 [Candidatus Wildermuthbacteria bacterium]|nr:hypothetical protein [Candidatus Wildermuthbacteria bacterium]